MTLESRSIRLIFGTDYFSSEIYLIIPAKDERADENNAVTSTYIGKPESPYMNSQLSRPVLPKFPAAGARSWPGFASSSENYRVCQAVSG